MRAAEEHARALMEIVGRRPFPYGTEEDFRWWIEVFGASEVEFGDMLDTLVARYRRTPFWRRRRRREIMGEYVKIYGLRTAAMGLETVWR